MWAYSVCYYSPRFNQFHIYFIDVHYSVNSVSCTYLRAHLWVLPAFTLPQTFGSTSFNPLTPETFAVIIAAGSIGKKTKKTPVKYAVWKHCKAVPCVKYYFAFKLNVKLFSAVCVRKVLTLVPGCS